MKKYLMAFALFLYILGPCLSLTIYADEYYDIDHYNVVIDVNSDNSYDIVETLQVDFASPRHGIYREIPLTYNNRRHKIKSIKVYDPATGDAYQTETTTNNGILNIRIGDPDIYVEGSMTYAIAYTYVGGVDYDQSMDEFYFNLIGTQWNTTIHSADFLITMPETFNTNSINITYGSYGSTNTDRVTFDSNGLTIKGSITAPLMPYEGLTLALPLPEGYYTEVNSTVPMGLFTAMVIGMCLISLYAFIKNRQYHNANIVVPVVSFSTPEGLNSAETAYIYQRESLNNTNMVSLILQWASNGYLTIDYEDHKFKADVMTFNKIKALPTSMPSYERTLFNDMFQKGSNGSVTTKDLQYSFYASLNTAMQAVRSQYREEKEILVNKVQVLTKVYAIVLALIFALFFGYVGDAFLRTGLILNMVVGLIIAVFLLIIFLVIHYISVNHPTIKTLIFMAIFILAFGLPLIGAFLAFYWSFFQLLIWNSPYSIALFLIFVAAYILGLWAIISIRQYTVFGLSQVNHIEGFREFLRTAKVDQMEMLYKKNPDYFYDVLPYAMALGLTDLWEKYVNRMSVAPPNWYHSNQAFRSHTFVSTMNRSFSTASAQPSSSSSGGSSGGGFSGGGGGGGGGGSW